MEQTQMNRRALTIVMLALLFSSGLPALVAPGAQSLLAAYAESGSGSDGEEDSGDDSDDSDSDDDSGDDSDDDSDDDSGGSSDDDGGSDDSGGDDSGGDDSGSGSGSGSGTGSGSGSGSDSGSGSGSASGGSDDDTPSEGASSDQDNGRLFGDNGIRVVFANGAREQLVKGQYERRDRRGAVVERRAATNADKRRLSAFRDQVNAGAAAKAGVQSVIVVKAAQAVQIVDVGGWTEKIEKGRYLLTDPKGNVVTKRRATTKDVARIRAAMGLR